MKNKCFMILQAYLFDWGVKWNKIKGQIKKSREN